MNLPVGNVARLIENRSDERDKVKLSNALRALANQQVNVWPDVVTTTDATLTDVWSDSMPPNSVADLWLVVVGVSPDGTAAAAYRRRAVFTRAGTGAVAFLGGGSDVIGTDRETDPTWTAEFTLHGGTPDMASARVGGAVGVTVTWRVNITGIVAPWTT